LLTIEVANKFQNCYKTIIQSLCDWSQWFSASASLLDECDQSDSVDVTLYTWNPITQDSKTLWYGIDTYPSTTTDKAKCMPGDMFGGLAG
jgi:hypothetical protein